MNFLLLLFILNDLHNIPMINQIELIKDLSKAWVLLYCRGCIFIKLLV